MINLTALLSSQPTLSLCICLSMYHTFLFNMEVFLTLNTFPCNGSRSFAAAICSPNPVKPVRDFLALFSVSPLLLTVFDAYERAMWKRSHVDITLWTSFKWYVVLVSLISISITCLASFKGGAQTLLHLWSLMYYWHCLWNRSSNWVMGISFFPFSTLAEIVYPVLSFNTLLYTLETFRYL